jgi:hypothetical protein
MTAAERPVIWPANDVGSGTKSIPAGRRDVTTVAVGKDTKIEDLNPVHTVLQRLRDQIFLPI